MQNPEAVGRGLRLPEYSIATECKAIVSRLLIEIHNLDNGYLKTKRRIGMGKGREKGRKREKRMAQEEEVQGPSRTA